MKITLQQVRRNFELLNGSATGAVKAYSTVACLLPGEELHAKVCDQRAPSFLPSVSLQLWRYSALCLSRVWDVNEKAISVMRLCRQVDQLPVLKKKAEFIAAKAQVEMLSESDARIEELRDFRDQSLSHTDPREKFQAGELDECYYELLRETCAIMDALHEVALDKPGGLVIHLDPWVQDATWDWKKMLSPFFEE